MDNQRSDETTLTDILKPLWKGRKLIIWLSVFGLVMGVFVALLIPNEFQASTVFVPKSAAPVEGNSSLKGLASIAGINLGGVKKSGNEISPLLYQKIMESVPLNKELLNIEIIDGDSLLTVEDYLRNRKSSFWSTLAEYTIGLPGKLKNILFKKEETLMNNQIELVQISTEEFEWIEELQEILTLTIQEDDGYIELSANLDNPVIAAQLVQIAETKLQQKIIELQTKGSLELLRFLEGQFAAKQKALNRAQDALAAFRDQNLNIASYGFSNQLTRLETNVQIATGVFQTVSAELEDAKLQVAKDTPVFSIIKPVVVPVEKSKPSRSQIVLFGMLIGGLLGGGISVAKSSIKEIWQEIRQD